MTTTTGVGWLENDRSNESLAASQEAYAHTNEDRSRAPGNNANCYSGIPLPSPHPCISIREKRRKLLSYENTAEFSSKQNLRANYPKKAAVKNTFRGF